MRKKAKDEYLMSLSKYNVVYYWHFITSSIIVVVIVVFAYKTINVVNASTPEASRDHLEREMAYKYANYFLNVYEPYSEEELESINSDIQNDETKEVGLENNDFSNDTENSDSSELDIDVNENVSNNDNLSNIIPNSSNENDNFVKNQDNLDNTIEKSSEIVYNNISEDNVSDVNVSIENSENTYESELSLKIVTDTNNNNSSNNIVASEDKLNAFRKLQLDYINNFYYNYVVKYYTNENAELEIDNSYLNEMTLFDLFLLNELLADIEINADVLIDNEDLEDKSEQDYKEINSNSSEN